MDKTSWLKAPLSLHNKKIWVAGHNGMVGQSLIRALDHESCDILTIPKKDLDLRNQSATDEWIAHHKPDIIILAAATVGGIGANSNRPAEFLYDNLMIESNIIHAAHKHNIGKLLFLGSSCIYPKKTTQPISENALLTGALETTNEPYAIAKIAGIKLCQSYRKQYGCDLINAMPCNLYGPGDKFDEEASHVIPALMMKAHNAKIRKDTTLTVWGSGKPLREFLYVDDLANALIFLLKHYSSAEIINIGSGKEITIAELAQTICNITGFQGALKFDHTKPDGTSRKLMNSARLFNTGWKPQTALKDGLRETYQYYQSQQTRHNAA